MPSNDPSARRLRRLKGNKFITKSGQSIKVHRSLTEKSKLRKDAKALRKAERMKGMPKSRVKRFFFRLHPKRVASYWFSRDGAIMALKVAGVCIVLGFFFLMAVFAFFRKDLPNLSDINANNIGGSVRYYDRTGQTLLWEDYDAVKRIPVNDEDISQYLKDATVAVEDRDFFKHSGFNVRGITRAAWNNAFGGSTQGGSTITQQVVKLNSDPLAERTFVLKIKELILSVELERSYSKKDILTGYLNAAPYGGIEYGVEAGARAYFQKSAKDVTLDEAAFLAAMPKSPSTFSPYSDYFDREELLGRQHYVLDIMAEMGTITAEQRDQAKAVDTLANVKERQPKYSGIRAPHFVLAAKRQLEATLSANNTYNRGWSVITTLDLDKQAIAEDEVAKGMPAVLRSKFDTAATVVEDVKTGQVVALVGGADFNDDSRSGKINYAQQPLPPGSSFKPYDYLALIDKHDNFGAGSVLFDTQGVLPGYPCTNKAIPKNGGNCLYDYDLRYPGPLTLRYSLGASRNVPAVKAMLITGVNETIGVAESLGLSGDDGGGGRGYSCYDDEELSVETECYGSSAIGDGAYLSLDRHVHSYATISRNGNKIPQTYILAVKDNENAELTDFTWKPSSGEQAVKADSAYIVADMMADPRASYMARKDHNYKGHSFSLKTGTTNDSKDGWMMGFSTQYSVGVWVGHHTRRVVGNGFMETMTQPIWRGIMQRVHDPLQPEARQKPAGLQTLPAYVVRGHVGSATQEPSPSTDLFPSWYKKPNSSATTKRVIDKVSNKLATDCTPDLAREEVQESDASAFSGDTFVNGGNSTEEQDDIHQCADAKPAVTLSVVPKPGTPGTYIMSALAAQGTHAWSSDQFKGTLNFKINGAVVNSREINANGVYTYEYDATSAGLQTVFAEVIDSVLYSGSSNGVDVNFVVAQGDEILPLWLSQGYSVRRQPTTSSV